MTRRPYKLPLATELENSWVSKSRSQPILSVPSLLAWFAKRCAICNPCWSLPWCTTLNPIVWSFNCHASQISWKLLQSCILGCLWARDSTISSESVYTVPQLPPCALSNLSPCKTYNSIYVIARSWFFFVKLQTINIYTEKILESKEIITEMILENTYKKKY